MDADRLATRVATFTSAASRRRLLGALSACGLGVFLTRLDADAKGKRKKKKKNTRSKSVTVCLNGQALIVPKSAVQSLLAQGATLGACSSLPPSPPPPPPPPAPPACQDQPDGSACEDGKQAAEASVRRRPPVVP